MVNSIWKNKIFILIALITLAFFPQTISKPAQTDVRSIVIGMGIDKIIDNKGEQAYELSAQIIVPHYSTSFNENAQVISAVGENVADAFERMSLHIGKIIGVGHCSIIVFGNGMSDENIMDTLDWFYRSKRLDNNAVVLFSKDTAKDILKTSIKADNNLSLSLNNIIQFNYDIDLTISQEILTLLDTYYKGHGANLISVLNLVEEDYLGLSVQDPNSSSGSQNSGESSSESSSGGENSESSQKTKYISNNGEVAIISNGKLVTILNSDQIRGFNQLIGSGKRGVVVLKNVNDEYFDNAEISVTERGQFVSYKLGFSPNGKPRIEYNLRYKIRLEQVINGTNDDNLIQGYNDYVSTGVKSAFKRFIKENCVMAVNFSKQYNVDCLGIYDKFDRLKHKEWQEYLNSLENKEDYIKDVEFFVNCEVIGAD